MASGFVVGTASVNNGSKIVTLDGGVDASQVTSGTAVFIGDPTFPPVEAISGTVGQITLRENWPNASQTSEPFTTIYTIEGLRDAVQKASDTSANMLAITSSFEDLLTSTDPSIDITINEVVTPFTPYQFLVDQFEASQVLLDAAIIPLSKSKLDNPLLHILKKNKLEDTIAGSITWTRADAGTFVDRYDIVQVGVIDTPREEKEGYLIEGASRNEALWARDLSNAVWVKTNITAVKDAIGHDGIASSASTLTANAINGTVFQPITLGSAERTFSFDVRRKTGTGTIEITDDGGSTFTDITSLLNSVSYTRVSVTTTQANPSIGFRMAITTDEIEVDYGQIEPLASASSRIPTTTVAAVRGRDDIAVTFNNNVDPSNGTVFIKYNYGANANAQSVLQIVKTSAVNTERLLIAANALGTLDQYIVTSGGVTQVSSTPSILLNQEQSVTLVYGDSSAIYRNGLPLSTAAGTVPPEGLDLINIGKSTLGAVFDFYGHINELRIYDFALNADQVKFLGGS